MEHPGFALNRALLFAALTWGFWLLGTAPEWGLLKLGSLVGAVGLFRALIDLGKAHWGWMKRREIERQARSPSGTFETRWREPKPRKWRIARKAERDRGW